MRGGLRGISALFVGIALASCTPAVGEFPCQTDSVCIKGGTQGSCVRGYCAFADNDCKGSLLRWDPTGAGNAGQCVPPEGMSDLTMSSGDRPPDLTFAADLAENSRSQYSLSGSIWLRRRL